MLTLDHEYIRNIVGTRPKDSHKGSNGRGLILAGSEGLTGAAVMSACAAQRGGIGLLRVLCPDSVHPAFYSLPEAMVLPCGKSWAECDQEKLRELIVWADCICTGPGMGRECAEAVKAVLVSAKPIIVDADGLNAIAKENMQHLLHDGAVITPHPGEMSRLTGLSVEKITADPANIAAEYAKKWNCTVLLKGAQSHIAAYDGRIARNVSGNPGLAKGGSGDVLSGIILALLGQGLTPYDAACAGAYILGASADIAMDILRERMLMSRDVTEAIEKTLESF